MKPERLVWLLVVGLMLMGGVLMGRALQPDEQALPEASWIQGSVDSVAFRGWFWEHRVVDLLVQVALVFAGALGVAAILPHPAETSEPTEPTSLD
ncbi:MAG: hypothetical protein ACP5HS_05860 [Anaerolineae bacterium]